MSPAELQRARAELRRLRRQINEAIDNGRHYEAERLNDRARFLSMIVYSRPSSEWAAAA